MMGNKVNPIAFRLQNNNFKPINNWFSTNKTIRQEYIIDDYLIRKCVEEYYSNNTYIHSIVINRKPKETNVVIKSFKPSSLIGIKGKIINKLNEQLDRISICPKIKVLVEFMDEFCNANIIANALAIELRAKRNVKILIRQLLMKLNYQNILGYKIQLQGRINSASKTKTLIFKNGKIPLQSINYDIDYVCLPVVTNYGIISVKVFICKNIITEDKQTLVKNFLFNKNQINKTKQKPKFIVNKNKTNFKQTKKINGNINNNSKDKTLNS